MATSPDTASAHDILRPRRQALDVFFRPSSVAVSGATENLGSVGRTVLWNLMNNSFGGALFPINPKRSSILGIKSYPDIRAVPLPIDLAVIFTPAASVPGIIGECVNQFGAQQSERLLTQTHHFVRF